MSEGPFPKTIPEAIPWITWGAVIFTFFLVFVEKLVESAYGQALSALIGGGIVTAVALHSKTWLEKTNPNWAFAASLALLFAIIASPWIEQKHWPFSAWFNGTSVEIREATLIGWLQQAQSERNEAKNMMGSAEAQKKTLVKWVEQAQQATEGETRSVAAAEAQKATLIGWLQTALHDRDDARQQYDRLQKTLQAQRLGASSEFLIAPPHPTAAEECVTLAQRLARLDPIMGKVEVEHVRSTMTALSCGCGASIK